MSFHAVLTKYVLKNEQVRVKTRCCGKVGTVSLEMSTSSHDPKRGSHDSSEVGMRIYHMSSLELRRQRSSQATRPGHHCCHMMSLHRSWINSGSPERVFAQAFSGPDQKLSHHLLIAEVMLSLDKQSTSQAMSLDTTIENRHMASEDWTVSATKNECRV